MFYYAQKAVLHPTAPLFDHETQALKPRCVRALKRIFILCDHDMDDALNDEELNEFQVILHFIVLEFIETSYYFLFKISHSLAFCVIYFHQNWQIKCFNAPLQPAEIVGVKRVVQEKLPQGVNDLGLTLTGFLFLHALFIEKGRLETTWTVLRKFGYNDEIKLKDDYLTIPFKKAPDQVRLFLKQTTIMIFV